MRNLLLPVLLIGAVFCYTLVASWQTIRISIIEQRLSAIESRLEKPSGILPPLRRPTGDTGSIGAIE